MISPSDILSTKQRFGIIGNHPVLNHAVQVAIQVAPTEMTVLISGESGSGKESFSKIIHSLSTRKHNAFIAINCGAIPEGTIDSELFGHEKGSFTGAHEARKGYFEVTDGGTIFLDEIGEMPLTTQARLLRVLENGEYIRVGSSKVIKTDVRVIAATNVKLLEAVEKGKFREDLYYRLSTVPIQVPPLRERGKDIYLLFRKFASDFSEKYHIKPIELTLDAQDELLKYRFPGNIRQLKNLVEQISALEMNREIDKPTLLKYLPSNNPTTALAFLGGAASNNEKESFSEREILYKILFDLKKDFSELKQIVFESLKTDGGLNSQILQNHKDLFDTINSTENNITKTDSYSPISKSYLLKSAEKFDEEEEENTIDISDKTDSFEEFEDESLSLESKEKEFILKALKKNHNKRKLAARDLGISERTLYRKIKQYGII